LNITFFGLVTTACLVLGSARGGAVEGTTSAGPIGGTDMRAAQLPPPGLYGGGVALYAEANRFFDGDGRAVGPLDDLHLTKGFGGAFLFYVPNVAVFGGSVGLGVVLPVGRQCGRLVAGVQQRCVTGIGDPYVEADWSRYLGQLRPSSYAGALPISEGLTVQLGLGAVIPVGRYDARDASQGLTVGNNLWDVAPLAAVTYVTPPVIAEGTEFSAKMYWNTYASNPDTHYKTGALINTDFAVTERIGRLQLGLAGFYAVQVADDHQDGFALPPDGRRARVLDLGGVVAFDLPEHATSVKVKALTSVINDNAVKSSGISVSFITKLY
jgi:hypothetical protein